MKNKIEDLRNHLFAQLEKLSDCNKSQLDVEINRANAMVEMAKTLIESAKVEVEFIKVTNGDGSEFFENKKVVKQIPN